MDARHINRRGLMAPQPAAQIAALDFAHGLEAFNRSLAACEAVSGDEDAVEAAADLAADMADKLIGIPTTDPTSIAQKVAAYGWLYCTTGDLRDPAVQRRTAEGSSDAAKGLLAIYLDLTASASAGLSG